jgi:hypothetical protein
MVTKFVLLLLAVNLFCLHAQGQGYHDVIITEIMADPSPAMELPEEEYLELFNRSAKNILLKGWKLTLGARSSILPESVLPANSYLIVCNKNSSAVLSQFGSVMGLNSFSLPNDGAVLSLYNATGQLIQSVSYSKSWWPAGKNGGGYSIEVVDTGNPCGDASNWAVATNPQGGTPGKENSIKRVNPDVIAPALERINVATPLELTLIFSEAMDSLNAVKGASIRIPGRNILSKTLESPAFRNLKITLDVAMISGQTYGVTMENLSDCAGNILRNESRLIGLPVKADSGDIILNEILFNPRDGGVDYIELYNKSGAYLSLKNWALGNLKTGKPDLSVPITNEDLVLGPHDFLVLTINPEIVKKQYPVDFSRKFLEMISLPGFPNTTGGVVLKNSSGKIWDLFSYTEEMHQALINNPKGVALEKTDPDKPGNDPENWHSAASIVGYGTPGYANSQRINPEVEDGFFVEPEAFSPDQDGVDDVANIRYTQQISGQMTTIRVFDLNGNLVRNILQNKLPGTNGSLSWDGTDETGNLIKTGYYLVLIDTFDLNGNKKQYRKRVVAAVK